MLITSPIGPTFGARVDAGADSPPTALKTTR